MFRNVNIASKELQNLHADLPRNKRQQFEHQLDEVKKESLKLAKNLHKSKRRFDSAVEHFMQIVAEQNALLKKKPPVSGAIQSYPFLVMPMGSSVKDRKQVIYEQLTNLTWRGEVVARAKYDRLRVGLMPESILAHCDHNGTNLWRVP